MIIKFILLVSLNILNVISQCERINQRKEIRELNSDELSRYLRAVRTLHTRADSSGQSFADILTRIHITYFPSIHNSGFFLPWHRFLLRLYEQRLQKIDPSVVMPYWNWALDYRHPEDSPILSNDMLGGNGGRNGCVGDGVMANVRVNIPNYHCLRRDYDEGDSISSLSSIEDIEALLNEPSFSEFSYQLEIIHGELHSNIGGDLKSRNSNNDPIFYLHHNFMDNLYSEWLRRHPNSRFETNRFRDDLDLNSKLIGFNGYIRDMIDSKAYPLCYQHQPFPNLPRGRFRSFELLGLKSIIGNKTMDQLILENKDKQPSGRTIIIEKLPTLKPISQDWIESNGFNIDEVRQFEARRSLFHKVLNQNEVFQPIVK